MTTREWLVKTFGPPSRTLALGEGEERLVYVYKREVTTTTGIVFLLAWHDEDTHEAHHYFDLRGGVVEKYWQEEVKCNNGGTFSMEGNQ